MEKVIKSVQTIGLSGMKKSKINEIKIMGMSLPVYIIAAFVILYAAMTGILPENMVGALAIMMVLGSALNLMGNKIPIVRSYLGGGAVFCPRHLRNLTKCSRRKLQRFYEQCRILRFLYCSIDHRKYFRNEPRSS